MKRNLLAAAGIAALAAVVIAAVWLQVSLWHECRATHSFFYCWRILG